MGGFAGVAGGVAGLAGVAGGVAGLAGVVGLEGLAGVIGADAALDGCLNVTEQPALPSLPAPTRTVMRAFPGADTGLTTFRLSQALPDLKSKDRSRACRICSSRPVPLYVLIA